MPEYRCTADKAWKQLDASCHARWFRHGDDLRLYMEGRGAGDSVLAAERVAQPIFYPVVAPAHKINLFDSIFSIGSCFARGIEWALRGRGLDVLSHKLFFDAIHHHRLPFRNAGGNNKYNTHSMLQELRWALEPTVYPIPDDLAVEGEDGQFGDVHAHCHITGAKRDILAAHRQYMTDVFRCLVVSRSIIITLGLTEVWFDNLTGLYINTTPTLEQIRRAPDRFTFEIMSFEENVNNLEQLFQLVQKHGLPDARLFVSVSPIPLAATFSGNDIVTANTYSKSVLRAAAETWSRSHEQIDYLPTYEMVLNSDRELAWENDQAHIRKRFFTMVARWFCDNYIETELYESLAAGAARYLTERGWRERILNGSRSANQAPCMGHTDDTSSAAVHAAVHRLITERMTAFSNPHYDHLEYSG